MSIERRYLRVEIEITGTLAPLEIPGDCQGAGVYLRRYDVPAGYFLLEAAGGQTIQADDLAGIILERASADSHVGHILGMGTRSDTHGGEDNEGSGK